MKVYYIVENRGNQMSGPEMRRCEGVPLCLSINKTVDELIKYLGIEETEEAGVYKDSVGKYTLSEYHGERAKPYSDAKGYLALFRLQSVSRNCKPWDYYLREEEVM